MWRVTVCLFDWTGKLLGTFVPYTTTDASIQVRQMEASRDPQETLKIAKQIVSVKFERMGEAAQQWGGEDYYEWIRGRHPLERVRSISETRAAESIVTEAYWAAFRGELKRRWPHARFKVRGHPTHGYKMKAVGPVNAALNYAYSILEAKARSNLARVGLSPYFGFLHSTLPGKEPLVYDLQEYERTTMDKAVLETVSDSAVQEEGFLRTADWTSRLTLPASRKLVETITSEFNGKIRGGTVDGRFYREALAMRTTLLS
jgi:CRISP-associated protein Cas1